MASLEDQAMSQGEQDISNTVDPDDIELVTRLGIQLLMQGGGINQIRQALDQSSDPGQVVGQFLAQLIAMLAEQLQGKIDLDPRVFLAKGGFLENILNFIEDQLGLPEEFSDQVWSEVVEVIKALAMNSQQAAQPGQGPAPQPGAQQAQPVPPQGPVPQQAAGGMM